MIWLYGSWGAIQGRSTDASGLRRGGRYSSLLSTSQKLCTVNGMLTDLKLGISRLESAGCRVGQKSSGRSSGSRSFTGGWRIRWGTWAVSRYVFFPLALFGYRFLWRALFGYRNADLRLYSDIQRIFWTIVHFKMTQKWSYLWICEFE